MEAFVIHRYAKDLEGASFTQVAEPAVGPGEVLIQVEAVALNPVDLKTLEGESKLILPMRPPFIPGVDLAGKILLVGPQVTGFQVGDSVWSYCGLDRMGAFAPLIALPADRVSLRPGSVDAPTAASLPLPALCAWQALKAGAVKAGSRILIHGGGGGVGHLAIQMAARHGAEVFTTASPNDLERVRNLGAQHIVDFRSQRFEEHMADLDFVFDTVGGDVTRRSLVVLRRGGTLASLHLPSLEALASGGLRTPAPIKFLLPLMTFGIRRRARRAGIDLSAQVTLPDASQLAEIRRWVEEGHLQTLVDRRFPFRELPEALRYLSNGKARGRVVVTLT
mgnify:CR=1 FL=1